MALEETPVPPAGSGVLRALRTVLREGKGKPVLPSEPLRDLETLRFRHFWPVPKAGPVGLRHPWWKLPTVKCPFLLVLVGVTLKGL